MTRPDLDRGNVAAVTPYAFGGRMDFDQLTDDELLAEITLESERRRVSEEAAKGGYARILAMFAAGRARTPPIMHRLLSDAAGVSDAAVINSLKKAAAATPTPSG